MGADLDSADDLQSYFDKSVFALKTGYDRAETNYFRPGMSRLQEAWASNPIITTFFIVLGALSIVPVLLFIIFSLAVTGIFMIIALGAALAASSTVVVFAGCILAGTLGVLFLLSLAITTVVASALLGVRAFSYVRNNGIPEGTIDWTGNVRGRPSGIKVQSGDDIGLVDFSRPKNQPEWSVSDPGDNVAPSECVSKDEPLVPPADSLLLAK